MGSYDRNNNARKTIKSEERDGKYLDGTTVGFNVNNITHCDFLFL